MKKFILKLVLLSGIVIILPFFLLQWWETRNASARWSTQSVLLAIPGDKTFDLLLMGTSHGQALSDTQYKQDALESVLNKRVLNISRGDAGVVEEKMYLSYFYSNHNQTSTIVYLIDPWILFSPTRNEKRDGTFNKEPLRLDFLLNMFANNIDPNVILSYVKTNFKLNWVLSSLLVNPPCESIQPHIPDKTKELLGVYDHGLSAAYFKKYSNILEEVVKITRSHHAKLIFIIPPTLMTSLPGKDMTMQLLSEFEKKYGIQYYDYSKIMQDEKFYRDTDHLNCNGAPYFDKNYLKPLLQ